MHASQPLRRVSLLVGFLLILASPAIALAAPTCGTNANQTCGLGGVLHVLYIAAAIMGALFLVVLGMVIRYYVRTKRELDTR